MIQAMRSSAEHPAGQHGAADQRRRHVEDDERQADGHRASRRAAATQTRARSATRTKKQGDDRKGGDGGRQRPRAERGRSSGSRACAGCTLSVAFSRVKRTRGLRRSFPPT